jgi:hypothetical protein
MRCQLCPETGANYVVQPVTTGGAQLRGSCRCGRFVGVDPALNQGWYRRVLITMRQGELASRFQRDHGRPPTSVDALQLAQQATLETREAKLSHVAWPSSAPPGMPKLPKPWADLKRSRT